MHEEYNALIYNNTYVLVPRPFTTNVVNCIWFFKMKYNAYESLSRYKVRLVANICSQQLDINCGETFNLVVKPTTIWTFLSLAILHHRFAY